MSSTGKNGNATTTCDSYACHERHNGAKIHSIYETAYMMTRKPWQIVYSVTMLTMLTMLTMIDTPRLLEGSLNEAEGEG